MSTELGFDSGHINADHGFTVSRLEGCRIVTGPVPLSDFPMLLHGFSDNAVMAADLASRMGVSFVIGEPDDIERLRQCNLPLSPERISDSEEAKKAGLPATGCSMANAGALRTLCARHFSKFQQVPAMTTRLTQVTFVAVCNF